MPVTLAARPPSSVVWRTAPSVNKPCARSGTAADRGSGPGSTMCSRSRDQFVPDQCHTGAAVAVVSSTMAQLMRATLRRAATVRVTAVGCSEQLESMLPVLLPELVLFGPTWYSYPHGNSRPVLVRYTYAHTKTVGLALGSLVKTRALPINQSINQHSRHTTSCILHALHYCLEQGVAVTI